MTGKYPMLGRIFLCLAMLVSLMVGKAASASPPAGALIRAQASVSFINPDGIFEVLPTNVVVTRINPVKALEVRADQTVLLTPDTLAHFPFFLRNAGNVPGTAELKLEHLTNDDFDPSHVAIIMDLNKDGFADPGEPDLLAAGKVDLQVGEEIMLLVQFKTPPGASEGTTGAIRLVATDGAASDAATGTVIISNTGLALEKSASLDQIEPGGMLRYHLRVYNRGLEAFPAYADIDGNPILIDGTPATGILVRDTIPLNTRFSAFGPTPMFTALYHISGQALHSYTSNAPSDLETVDAVAFFAAGDFPRGATTELTFDVVVGGSAPNTVQNIASTWQGISSGLVELQSNPVRTRIIGEQGADLGFIDENGNEIAATGLNTNVFLRLNASACNVTAQPDVVQVRIISDPEGDVETVTATETGPNTGVFSTSVVPIQPQLPAVQENSVLSANKRTKATASVVCGGTTVSATLFVNVGGFIFMSDSNRTVPGATIAVYDDNGTEVERLTSDQDGFFVLTSIAKAGTYRIVVEAAESIFPSTRKIFLGWGRNVHMQASYGIPFTTKGLMEGIDIPLDPRQAALTLTKSVDRTTAEPGDLLAYTLQLTSSSTLAAKTFIHDHLPEGIAYMEGSARIGGADIPVTGGSGPELTFDLSSVAGNGTVELTYIAAVEARAKGSVTNTAYAETGSGASMRRSNEARATVKIKREGVIYGDEGVVIGKVYVDLNGDGIQNRYRDAGGNLVVEPGVPGVKIFFENGANVVTDSEGKYSMPGLSSETHVAALSSRTLPATVEPKSTSTRDALSPLSRFIRLEPGQVTSEYFALAPRAGFSQEDVLHELADRMEAFAAMAVDSDVSSIRPGFDDNGWVDYDAGAISKTDEATRRTMSELFLNEEGEGEGAVAGLQDPTQPVVIEGSRDMEAEISGFTPDLAFLELSADDLLRDTVITVRVKGPAEGKLGLTVNGHPVSEKQIGQHLVYSAGDVQAAEYVAIRLEGGRNRLELTLSDTFGNVRQSKEIEVLAPGKPVRIELVAPPAATADPTSPIPVLVRLVDADNVPTYASMDVTLETNGDGRWGVEDFRATQPGIQVFLSRGEALLDYYPPALAGSHRIAVKNGLGRSELEIKLLPGDQERVIVGVVEGVVQVDRKTLSTSGLEEFDETTTGLRGALYLKGKIRGDALLTMRYESDENTEERLFRDVDPDRYYPVYGDRSERGFDAQSNSSLYVKVEKGLNYILYGDVSIGPQSSEFQLGSYSRSLTGAQAHLEGGPLTINLFAGRTDTNQIIREFRAEGLSGPYDLDLTDYVEGSERVEVVTRDRRQPTTVLGTTLLERYRDYRLDHFDDAILFTNPILASDDEGNPNFLRITYELEGGGDAYWIYAGEARLQVNDYLTVGYREIHSDAEDVYEDRRTTRAAYVAADLGKYGKAEAEVAQNIDRTEGEGYAGRIGYEVDTDHVTVRARATHTQDAFVEGASTAVAGGRNEAALEADWRLYPSLDLRTSLLYDQRDSTGEERWGGEALAKWSANSELRLTAGLRYLRRNPGGDQERESIPSAVLGGEWRPSAVPSLALRGEVEGDLTDASHLRGLLEASHQTTERMKLYASVDWATRGSEFLDFSSGGGMRATAKAGVEYRVSDEITSFSEARSGSQTGLAGGIKGDWKRGENANIYASIEHFQPYVLNSLRGSLIFDDAGQDQSSETSFAAGYIASLDDGMGRLALAAEASLRDGGYTLYNQQYWSRRIKDWTWALENRLAWSDTDSRTRLRDHLRGGVALRPDGETIDALFLGGVKVERDFGENRGSSSAYWSAAGSWSLSPDSKLTAKQAGQYTGAYIGDISNETFLLLAQLGLEKDIELKEELRMRLSLNTPVFYDVFSGRHSLGLGGEIGFVPAANMLVSAGYNWADVEADAVSEIFQSGAFFRLSMKLDDTAWNLFDRMGVTVPVGGQPEPMPKPAPVYTK